MKIKYPLDFVSWYEIGNDNAFLSVVDANYKCLTETKTNRNDVILLKSILHPVLSAINKRENSSCSEIYQQAFQMLSEILKATAIGEVNND